MPQVHSQLPQPLLTGAIFIFACAIPARIAVPTPAARPSPKPTKPLLKGHTAAEAKLYSQELEAYEENMKQFSINMKAYKDADYEADIARKKILCDYYGLDRIPKQYQEKVWKLAWDQGHSGGWSEVGYQLDILLDIFSE